MDFDQVADDAEVGCVVGDQRYALDLCGRSDRQVDLTAARSSAPFSDCGSQPTPSPGYLNGHRKRIERRLDSGEPIGASPPLLDVRGNDDAEVQLCDRRNTDCTLDICWRVFADQDRGVQYGSHRSKGSVRPASKSMRSSSSPCGAGPSQTLVRDGPLTQRRRCAGESSATGRPATVTVSVSPPSTRRSTSLTWLRSSFCGMVPIPLKVALLLPASTRHSGGCMRYLDVAEKRISSGLVDERCHQLPPCPPAGSPADASSQ